MKIAMTKTELIALIKNCEKANCNKCVLDFFCDLTEDDNKCELPVEDILIVEPFQDVKVVD